MMLCKLRRKMNRLIKKILEKIFYIVNYPALKFHNVKLERGCCIRGRLYIKTPLDRDSIFIGEGTNINSSLQSNPIGGNSRTILCTRGTGEIRIGKRVGISNSALVATESITIGDDTNIGGGTVIYDTDFHSLRSVDRLSGDKRVKSASVIIGKRVFVGGHCIILKGSEIGDNAVIGAGSVVSGKIPANEIWAGNPARKIKDNI